MYTEDLVIQWACAQAGHVPDQTCHHQLEFHRTHTLCALSTVSGLNWSQRRNKRRNIYALVRIRRRHTVVVLSVCLSVTRISQRSLKAKRWYEHYMYIMTFARTWIFDMKFPFSNCAVIYSPCMGLSWQSGLLWRQDCLQLGALQLVGSTGAKTEHGNSASPPNSREKAYTTYSYQLNGALTLWSHPADYMWSALAWPQIA